MDYEDRVRDENERIRERYELATQRLESMLFDGIEIEEKPLFDYFVTAASFLLSVKETVHIVMEGLDQLSLEALSQLNEGLYSHIREKCVRKVSFPKKCPENCVLKGKAEDFRLDSGVYGLCYENSFANPAYAMSRLGEKYGTVLCFLFAEMQALNAYAFERRLFDITITMELFLEIYNCFEAEEEPYEAVKSAIYYHFKDYSEIMMEKRIRELVDPSLSFAADLIMKADLSNPRYLYYYGEYITSNELMIAEYLNNLPKEEIEAMAATYVEGYRRGFEEKNIDLGKKSTVNIRYCLGFERIIREAIEQFSRLGLKPVIYRASLNSLHKGLLKIGYHSTSPNRQFEYDHRFDKALFFKKSFLEKKLAATRKAFEKYKDLAGVLAGPALLQVFGEKDFEPEEKPEALKLSDKQQRLSVWYQFQDSLISNEYINRENSSFTIMALPIPDIGEDFESIFKETVRVNTLNQEDYQRIQQKLIDTLDLGEYVHIKGAGDNRTDLRIMLHPLSDPSRETNFKNCLATVNIPVGEVFTSPVLLGTKGVLHVSKAYLRDLKYMDLELTFEDGKISAYTCQNFKSQEENARFIKENLMNQHDTLPLGEFAIGTNTTAYMMGKRFGISPKLPILIAEKTGPHFAVGDTCYQRSEERKTYNPDGKEIVAKDNECSLLRETEPEKAYFGCHTDITIPYHELDEITVYPKSREAIPIIKNGRFVLEGTQELNRPFDE